MGPAHLSGLPNAQASLDRPLIYCSGVHGYWTLTLIDGSGSVWGSNARLSGAMPDGAVTRVTLTVDESGPRVTIRTPGQPSKSYLLCKLP
jgi:hypothetical protein